MKFSCFTLLFPLIAISCSSSKKVNDPVPEQLENTLLWEISGNGISRPSYLFGTMHLVCREDAVLTDGLIKALQQTEQVYFEVDMDNMIEMLGVLRHMKMKNDTTLADLMSMKEYEELKEWIDKKNSMLPFSVLETYKPMLAASTLMELDNDCDGVAMEMVIMEEAKKLERRVNGLESMSLQMSIFDSIPYKVQAQQLLRMMDEEKKGGNKNAEFEEMINAYRQQDLSRLGQMIQRTELGLSEFEGILLTNRNVAWVNKLKGIMANTPVTVAVGAGHLPGNNGLISLLRKQGYTVRPLTNRRGQATI